MKTKNTNTDCLKKALAVVREEKDLEVTISNDLKCSEQVHQKVNRMLGFIARELN